MNSRFSKRAQGVLIAAKKRAEDEGGGYPGPVHLLDVVLSEKGGSAIVLLRKSGFEIRKLQADFRLFCAECGKGDPSGSESSFSEITEAALAEANRLGMETAGTAHILLALLSHHENPATMFLRKKGFDLLQLRKLVLATLGEAQKGGTSYTIQRPALFAAAGEWKEDPERSRYLVSRYDCEERVRTRIGRADSPNVALVGEKGAGKTSVLSTVVRRLKREMSPMLEVPVRVFRLELFQLIGWRWRRAQQKITDFLNEIRMPGPFVLVIDDLELFCGTMYWDEALFFLRLILSNSCFPVIVELERTTWEDFVQDDPFFISRIHEVVVPLPEGDEALRILYAVRDRLETFHGIKISDGAVKQAFTAASELRHDAFIFSCGLLDQVASEVQTGCRADDGTVDLTLLEEKLRETARKKQEAVEMQDYQRAAMLRDEEKSLRQKKVELSLSSCTDQPAFIDAAFVQSVFERLCPQPSEL